MPRNNDLGSANALPMARPGDGGPCPICGEDMAAKSYPSVDSMFPKDVKAARGRYWHMLNEHGIFEDYVI